MKQTLWKAVNSFSRKERQGILVLLLLTGICVTAPDLWERCFPPSIEVYTADSLLLAEVVEFRNSLVPRRKVFPGDADSSLHSRRFPFDPNTIGATEWAALGLDKRVTGNIQRYLEKGGRFRRKEDLQKIYGLSAELYNELQPFIRISMQQHVRDTSWRKAQYKPYGLRKETQYERKITELEVNTADSVQWESLPGIGPVLAARIVKFRERLGGFYSIRQIGETYGLADSTFNKIQPYLRLRKVSLKKLDLNLTDEKSLAQHPYIRYKLARLIVLYRSNHGPFDRPEGLLGIPLVDDSIYRKIEHYIKTENSPL
ncbi:helix-hairpin-helix domain-containing protein [Chitinophaga sp. S165]|uniref:helix-hairpin-helix domain-containing protein n=1 Tax=Chitinophaga sp. S165 TaxID=2135462 RepID=UPI000D719CC6|nr:helix-hairpin-helix domain-containing protein [Chitinophaga sp. S165]PWV53344.1 helix-hairpin-helix protein [Chitinophaga sp. S165]